MAIFTHVPSYSSSLEVEPDITEVNFGDGYQQATFNGIHEEYRKFSLTFSKITQVVANEIDNFFITNKSATTSFDWTPPDGVAGKFKCKKRKTKYLGGGDIVNLTCEFEEVFF